MEKVINRDVAKLLTMATLCRIAGRSGGPFSSYLAGIEMAFMSTALETMLRGDIDQQLAAEIGEGIEQCLTTL